MALLTLLATIAAATDLPGPLGSAHPLFVQAAAADGSWVVACQARADTDGDGDIQILHGMHGELYGDALAPYLLTPSLPLGQEIDAFIAEEKTGRWLVVEREGMLELHDMRTGAVTLLGPPVAPDRNPTYGSRAAAFSDAGEVVYLSGEPMMEVVRVRALDTGAERILNAGAGRVWRAEWRGGGWVAVALVAKDTNGNGVLDLPSTRTSLAGGACLGEPSVYGVYGMGGDEVEWHVLRAADGAVEPRPILASAATGIVVRGVDGGIVWVPMVGEERTVAPPSCTGPVLGLLEDAAAVLAVCGDPAAPVLYDAAGAHPMVFPLPGSRGLPRPARFIQVGGYQLADLERHSLIPRAYAGEQGFYGDHLLQVDKAETLRWIDVVTGAERVLLKSANSYAQQFGRWVALRGSQTRLIDMQEGVIAGYLTGRPVVVREDGAALVPTREGVGPLRWERARP